MLLLPELREKHMQLSQSSCCHMPVIVVVFVLSMVYGFAALFLLLPLFPFQSPYRPTLASVANIAPTNNISII